MDAEDDDGCEVVLRANGKGDRVEEVGSGRKSAAC